MRILIALPLLFACNSYAGSWGGYPVLGFQFEVPSSANGSHFCQEGDSQLVSHAYLRQPLYTHKGFQWNVGVNHKSCSFGADRPSYDAIGTGFELNTCYIFGGCK